MANVLFVKGKGFLPTGKGPSQAELDKKKNKKKVDGLSIFTLDFFGCVKDLHKWQFTTNHRRQNQEP